MTKEFVQSQVEYYKRNLNCGPSRDWNQIRGLYHYYQSLLRKFEENERTNQATC